MYDDIIDVEFKLKHPRMDKYKRAAIFSPFAALTGYEDSIKETARRVDKKVILDDNIKDIINEKLVFLKDKDIDITITYFVKDKYKDGGKYIDVTNKIKKIDLINKKIYLLNKICINIDDVLDIEY